MSGMQVGISLTATFESRGTAAALGLVRVASDAGLDYLQVGDHVSFHDGTGFDGLILAAAALSVQDSIPVHVGLYLLALRHPVPVARQLAELGRLAPGRLTLGVGVGGEDRHEFEVCGVDPRTRGARTDEALKVVRALLTGESVTHHGRFFDIEEALIRPTPVKDIPFVIGGRSDAALRRVARFGDGWLGVWASARRYAEALGTIDEFAEEAGRVSPRWQHGINVWCAVPGADGLGGQRLAEKMEDRYKLDFKRFERWCPIGTPSQIADFLRPYQAAGCTSVTLTLPGSEPQEAVDAAAQIRAALAR